MTRSEWKQAWHVARLIRVQPFDTSRLRMRIRIALECLKCREARSAELGLSPIPTTYK